MKYAGLLLLMLSNMAAAEIVGDSIDTLGRSYSNYGAETLTLESKLTIAPVKAVRLNVIKATGRFRYDFADGGHCVSDLKELQNGNLIELWLEPNPRGRRQPIGFGEVYSHDQFPLRRGNLVSEMNKLRHFPQTASYQFDAAYDGSALTVIAKRMIDGQAVLQVHELWIDPSGKAVSKMRVREFLGTDLKNAKPTENEVVCEDLIG